MFDLLFLAAATPESTGNPIIDLANTFGVDWRIILAQIVNFALVAYLLWRFAFKRVMASMEERQKQIADGLRFADESKLQLAEAEKTKAEIIRAAQAEGQEILREVKEKAQAFHDQQTKETSQKVEEMLQRGREANELERQKMLSEVRREIASLVVLTSAKVLRSELQDVQKQRINEAAAAEIARSN
ncbi:MAG: F0F1 ATP synthase subunit B [Verrucomicrobia bacterium]|nr:F0F1 ATP synthase subunit B [Verrucomicrobiota bacterium]